MTLHVKLTCSKCLAAFSIRTDTVRQTSSDDVQCPVCGGSELRVFFEVVGE